MKQKLIVLLLLATLCSIGYAQVSAPAPAPPADSTEIDLRDSHTKKELRDEIVKNRKEKNSLRAKIDSLMHLLNSKDNKPVQEPEKKEEEKPEVKEVKAPEPKVPVATFNPDPIGFFSEDPDSVDVERFSMNVSDAVLIKRLENMNCVIEIPFNETVKNYMIRYAEKNRSGMEQMMGLAKFYFPVFEETLNRYGLPLEIKYLAIIESALKPLATSPVGAKGLWQFMYGTAKEYGLRITNYVDERVDIFKSVDAACRYLLDAYDAFGDWSLALSSYNCGPGNVQRAIRASGSKQFWKLYPYLPAETRGYVPALVGAMYAMTYYKEHGLHPAENPMPGQIDTIQINHKVHFRQISEMVGVPMDVLTFLNPQYLRQVIPGNEDVYVLHLPEKWANQFRNFDRNDVYGYNAEDILKSNVVTTGSSHSSSQDSDSKSLQAKGAAQQVHTTYKVGKGDTIESVASKYHVKTTDIQRWNHMKSSMLIAGSTLHIYLPPGSKVPSVSSSFSYKSSSAKTHTVKSGESLGSIAQKYGVGLTSLKNINGLKSNTIKAGQKLRIPAK